MPCISHCAHCISHCAQQPNRMTQKQVWVPHFQNLHSHGLHFQPSVNKDPHATEPAHSCKTQIIITKIKKVTILNHQRKHIYEMPFAKIAKEKVLHSHDKHILGNFEML